MARISIITAFLNEAENLPRLRRSLSGVLRELVSAQVDHGDLAASANREISDYEIVLVDDHSSDVGGELAKQWALEDGRVKYLRLSRNFGSHAAFSAGLARCTGDCAVLLAADLQDPPDTIPHLVQQWRDGYDVVWAVRANREGESLAHRAFAAAYYQIMRRLASRDIPSQGAGFLLLDRKVAEAYNAIPEKHANFAFIITLLGFRQTSIEFVKPLRQGGVSKWTLSKKFKLVVDSVVSFSHLPLRLASILGMILATCGLLYAAVVITGRLCGWISAGTGFAALMTVLLIGQGAILTMLGVVGEYLWRVFDEVRGRPRYVIEEQFQASPAENDGSRLNSPAPATALVKKCKEDETWCAWP